MSTFKTDLAKLHKGNLRSIYKALVVLYIRDLGKDKTRKAIAKKTSQLNANPNTLHPTLYILEGQNEVIELEHLNYFSVTGEFKLTPKGKEIVSGIHPDTVKKLELAQKAGVLQITHLAALLEMGSNKLVPCDALRAPVKENWNIDLGKGFLSRFTRTKDPQRTFISRNEHKEFFVTHIGEALLKEINMVGDKRVERIVSDNLDKHTGYQRIRDIEAVFGFFRRYVANCRRMVDFNDGKKARDVISRNYVKGAGVSERWAGRAYILHLVGYQDNRISKTCFDSIVKSLAIELEK